MAQADSVGSVYDPEVPRVPDPPKKNNSIDDPKAGTSNDDGGATAPEAPSEGEGTTESGGTGGSQGSGGGGGGDAKAGKDGGTGQGNPGKSPEADSQVGLGDGTQVANTQPADDGGSSSPLVPILIAVAALAAISVGAVLVRNRRQGGASDAGVSPKAS